jgi:hypothetical protein
LEMTQFTHALLPCCIFKLSWWWSIADIR